MDGDLPKLPKIEEKELTPTVLALLEYIHALQVELRAVKDELAKLKGQPPRPKLKPSRLESTRGKGKAGRRRGWAKREKTRDLEIHEEVVVAPVEVPPPGSRFKGYQDFTVQDIEIRTRNTRYRLERWQLPDGSYVVGQLPAEVSGRHFGPDLVCFILYQYHHANVTQPLLAEQLREFGVDISAGQISRIIIEDKERFHEEKDEILRVGLRVSGHIHVDDTGARHKGKNGYCTHIGNDLFAWFSSTEHKSRVNFLELLRAGRTDYVLSDAALEYMRAHKLPAALLAALSTHQDESFEDKKRWEKALESLGIIKARHVRTATEGALLGSVLEGEINPDLAIVSDDAGQFRILLHALCWIHAERTLAKLLGFNDSQRAALEQVRTQIWDFYKELKAYKLDPTEEKKAELQTRFDEIFGQKTCFQTLNGTLKRLARRKKELLLVLERPDVPLHNNLSEGDVREFVKRRKISGATRSDAGRRCRDSFASLKKTCRKHGISFWKYLKARITGSDTIPPLPNVILARSQLPVALGSSP